MSEAKPPVTSRIRNFVGRVPLPIRYGLAASGAAVTVGAGVAAVPAMVNAQQDLIMNVADAAEPHARSLGQEVGATLDEAGISRDAAFVGAALAGSVLFAGNQISRAIRSGQAPQNRQSPFNRMAPVVRQVPGLRQMWSVAAQNPTDEHMAAMTVTGRAGVRMANGENLQLDDVRVDLGSIAPGQQSQANYSGGADLIRRAPFGQAAEAWEGSEVVSFQPTAFIAQMASGRTVEADMSNGRSITGLRVNGIAQAAGHAAELG